MSKRGEDTPMYVVDEKSSIKDRRAAASEARTNALRRLRDMHPEDYRRLYNEEARRRGVMPAGERRQLKIDRLRRELAEAERTQP